MEEAAVVVPSTTSEQQQEQEWWNDEELDETLYQSDNDTSPVLEYKMNSTEIRKQQQMQQLYRDEEEKAQRREEEELRLERQNNLTITNRTIDTGTNNAYNNTANEEKVVDWEYVYLDIDLSDENQVHVVEFYAPWCPHCQHYKPEYVDLARDVQHRAINTHVIFHAVSCTLNEIICLTYEVDGYPTIYGWRGGNVTTPLNSDSGDGGGTMFPPITDFGIPLDGPSAESIAKLMNFEIAGEVAAPHKQQRRRRRNDGGSGDTSESASDSSDTNYTSADERAYEAKIEAEKVRRGHEVAAWKQRTNEYYGSLNELYHDATVSLAFFLKTGVYTTVTSRGSTDRRKLAGDRVMALRDFLVLLEWSTPSWWSVRRGLVRDLVRDLEKDRSGSGVSLVKGGKEGLSKILEPYQVSMTAPRRTMTTDNKLATITTTTTRHDDEHLLWGYILRNGPGVQNTRQYTIIHERTLGGDAPIYRSTPLTPQTIIKKNMQWTRGCTHDTNRHAGYTCGLWHIFHIVTIGASKPENRLYGFTRGYDVSPRMVAETIRNFVEYFFGCEVCRSNFLGMYDSCGHDHCSRLSRDGVIPLEEGGSQSKELALWLFEVHNAVNVRLMKESAERDDRIVSKEEELAAKFPSRQLCPKCWLDDDMERYNRDAVFNFLQGWYWPVADKAELNAIQAFDTTRDYSIRSGGYHILTITLWLCLIVLLSLTVCSTILGKDAYAKKRWIILRAFKKSDKIK